MNVTIITGWIAAVLMIGNFATCLVTPWANKKFGECKEKEGCTGEKCHAELLGKYHKPFVWLTILATIIHIVLAIMS